MELISIQIEGERVQFVKSGGVTPGMGIRACEAVTAAFRELLVQAEVERRVEALTHSAALRAGPRPPLPEAGRGGDTGEQEN